MLFYIISIIIIYYPIQTGCDSDMRIYSELNQFDEMFQEEQQDDIALAELDKEKRERLRRIEQIQKQMPVDLKEMQQQSPNKGPVKRPNLFSVNKNIDLSSVPE